ncbi:MAG: phosphonate metabolism transcriptional regulator PhnF [Pseudomonadota bacterium]
MTTPIWISIKDTLSREIGDGRFLQGTQLPTEAELARRFAVNRHTVRRAIGAMRNEGLVRSRRGAGVFVSGQPIDYRLGKRTRFRQSLEAEGRQGSKRILRLETIAATAREAKHLQIAIGASITVMETVGVVDNAPLTYARSTFPTDRLEGLNAALERRSGRVTDALRDCGIPDYRRAWTRVTAEKATAALARHLEVLDGAPLIRTRSLNVDLDGVPVELGRTFFCADRVELLIEAD